MDRWAGVVLSLATLSIPTILLASALTVGIFAALRIAQGLCMATAFSLTLACPGEMQDYLPVLLAGMTQVAIGTFLPQALASGFVSRAAMGVRAAASGLCLARYFPGGLLGAVILGQVYTRCGWTAL